MQETNTPTPDDFIVFVTEQVDGLATNSLTAIQRSLTNSPLDVCTWVQDNLTHWLELARDTLHRNVTVHDMHQTACDIVTALCKHYHVAAPK